MLGAMLRAGSNARSNARSMLGAGSNVRNNARSMLGSMNRAMLVAKKIHNPLLV